MKVALALTSTDRFLLRSAARLSLHLGEPDRAHSLLVRSEVTKHDPWLVAAEIAIAPLADRTSRLHKHGQRLLASRTFRPIAISELASALGTETLAAGSTRRARRLFEASLDDPTENAVAQAQWASNRGAGFDFERSLLDVEDSFEARAHFFANEGNVDESLGNTWEWLREQPFASNPAIFGSYRAAVGQRYGESARFAEFGLVANPDEFLLRNNLAFALASSGEVESASRHVARIQQETLSEEHRLVFTATRGLIAFREGDIPAGRRLYTETIREARDPALRVIAAILLAREEIAAGTSVAPAAQAAAQELSAAIESHARIRDDIPAWLAQLNEPAHV